MTDQPQQAPDRLFQIQKIYLKDVSLEAPNAPHIFRQQWEPEIGLQLNNAAFDLGEDTHEVVLTLTVTAKLQDKTAYIVEIQQAGIFTMKGYNKDEMGQLLGAFCPNVLFPFAREAVSDLVTKGGFPPLLLAPINFDLLYQEQLQKEQAQQQGNPAH